MGYFICSLLVDMRWAGKVFPAKLIALCSSVAHGWAASCACSCGKLFILSIACRYVLDLRNNGGGSFPAGVAVARMFIDNGDVVLIADSQGIRDTYDATGPALESKAPLSVLVNKGTASASEVTHVQCL